jgi:hypothetical protein
MWISTHTVGMTGLNQSSEMPRKSRPQPQKRASTLKMIRYVCGRMNGQMCLACRPRLLVTMKRALRRRKSAWKVALHCVQKFTMLNSSELTIEP